MLSNGLKDLASTFRGKQMKATKQSVLDDETTRIVRHLRERVVIYRNLTIFTVSSNETATMIPDNYCKSSYVFNPYFIELSNIFVEVVGENLVRGRINLDEGVGTDAELHGHPVFRPVVFVSEEVLGSCGNPLSELVVMFKGVSQDQCSQIGTEPHRVGLVATAFPK